MLGFNVMSGGEYRAVLGFETKMKLLDKLLQVDNSRPPNANPLALIIPSLVHVVNFLRMV